VRRILDRLQEKHAVLTKSERQIAVWLEGSVERLAFLTVNEVSRQTEVSEATIVRFARKLGFDSYSALQREVQLAVQQQFSLGDKLQQSLDSAHEGPLKRSYQRDLDNLRRTYEQVDQATFERAVSAIASAQQVGVVGLRASAGVAVYLAFALNLVRPGVVQIRPDIDAVHDQLLDFSGADAVIAVSLSRPALKTLETVREAKQRYGVTVIALTNSTMSPLAQLADHVLVVMGEGTFNSYTATFSMAGALLDGVATELRESATARLRRLDAVNSESIYAG
jgi:DNA-binding MurR/RpiR family transcriptional regulator